MHQPCLQRGLQPARRQHALSGLAHTRRPIRAGAGSTILLEEAQGGLGDALAGSRVACQLARTGAALAADFLAASAQLHHGQQPGIPAEIFESVATPITMAVAHSETALPKHAQIVDLQSFLHTRLRPNPPCVNWAGVVHTALAVALEQLYLRLCPHSPAFHRETASTTNEAPKPLVQKRPRSRPRDEPSALGRVHEGVGVVEVVAFGSGQSDDITWSHWLNELRRKSQSAHSSSSNCCFSIVRKCLQGPVNRIPRYGHEIQRLEIFLKTVLKSCDGPLLGVDGRNRGINNQHDDLSVSAADHNGRHYSVIHTNLNRAPNRHSHSVVGQPHLHIQHARIGQRHLTRRVHKPPLSVQGLLHVFWEALADLHAAPGGGGVNPRG
mmetsp:Transcript_78561/g.179789  ORF Transcript_78561/g.179789 Transcript_78561/m.179789 type:complete len:382 (-) Transcript_78561:688-1833(-)